MICGSFGIGGVVRAVDCWSVTVRYDSLSIVSCMRCSSPPPLTGLTAYQKMCLDFVLPGVIGLMTLTSFYILQCSRRCRHSANQVTLEETVMKESVFPIPERKRLSTLSSVSGSSSGDSDGIDSERSGVLDDSDVASGARSNRCNVMPMLSPKTELGAVSGDGDSAEDLAMAVTSSSRRQHSTVTLAAEDPSRTPDKATSEPGEQVGHQLVRAQSGPAIVPRLQLDQLRKGGSGIGIIGGGALVATLPDADDPPDSGEDRKGMAFGAPGVGSSTAASSAFGIDAIGDK